MVGVFRVRELPGRDGRGNAFVFAAQPVDWLGRILVIVRILGAKESVSQLLPQTINEISP
ncbi:MAG TPA: hypothetical protein DEF45_08655 [Rhodopirellula sp.]|nr:hypothetical protein [Rhodopirellula sp.]